MTSRVKIAPNAFFRPPFRKNLIAQRFVKLGSTKLASWIDNNNKIMSEINSWKSKTEYRSIHVCMLNKYRHMWATKN